MGSVTPQAKERIRVRVADLSGELPTIPPFDGEDTLDVPAIAGLLVDNLASIFSEDAPDWFKFSSLFAEDSWWKDSLTLTFDKRTLHCRATVVEAWKKLYVTRRPSRFVLSEKETWGLKPSFTRLSPALGTLDVPFAFSTNAPRVRCVGVAKLIPIEGDWKIWILTTGADHLVDHPFQSLPRTDFGVVDASQRGKVTGQGLPRIEGVLDAIVVGGGPSGMGNVIMLESIGANVIMCDIEDVPGGSWSVSRYEAVQLHHPRNMIQLPMFPAPADDFQEYLTGKDVGRYYAKATRALNLPFFGGVRVVSNHWHEEQKIWETTLQDVKSGKSVTVNARNLVLSNGFLIGHSNVYIPKLTNMESFDGPIQHTDAYRTAEPYRGKDIVIVGAGNSAHDVAKDLAINGAKSVTILQRRPIVFIDFDIMGPVMSMMYQGQMLVEAADFMQAGLPIPVARDMFKPVMAYLVQSMGEKNDILEQKGYELNKAPDLISSAYEARGKSFYMDQPRVYDLIVEDRIKIARGEAIGFVKDGLIIQNGEEKSVLPAQGIVLATGYENTDVPKIYAETGFVDTVSASKLENVGEYSVDAEGEQVGFTTASGHDHLYFAGVGFYMARYIGKYIAIQVTADVKGEFPQRLAR